MSRLLALLFGRSVGVACVCVIAHAAVLMASPALAGASSAVIDETLTMQLLPPTTGEGDAQLAVSWQGAVAGRLHLVAVDAGGHERALGPSVLLTPGMHIQSLALAPDEQLLRARLSDAAGHTVAEAEQSAQARMPTLTGAVGGMQTPTTRPSDAAAQGSVIDWRSDFAANNGPDEEVHAVAVWNDGSGDAIYIGGDFRTAGGFAINRIARWNGQSWSALGNGMNGRVSALIVHAGALVAAGSFTQVDGQAMSGIARWDGARWSAFGSGLGNVAALAIYNGELVAGGYSIAGEVPPRYIARWTGSAWSELGGGLNQPVESLIVHEGALIAGGYFTMAGDQPARGVARWNGSAWSALGEGVPTPNRALAVYNGDLVAAGGVSQTSVRRWNGTTWSVLGSALSNGINALSVYRGELIAAGRFTFQGTAAIPRVARWNGSTWSTLGGGTNREVRALTVFRDELVAVGAFSLAGENAANRVARWNGSSWLGASSGVDRSLVALAVYDGKLVVAGNFAGLNGTVANSIASWDGVGWSRLGSGMNSSVYALAVYNGELIAGGAFTRAGDVAAEYVARWNGTSWAPLAEGLSDQVYDLIVHDGELVAAGIFYSVSGGGLNSIARWNGSRWAELAGGANNAIYTLAVYRGELIAGGAFSSIGGVAANYVGRWNGSSWAALGTGTNNHVSVLNVHDQALVAGGYFTSAGGIAAAHIARWDGSAWASFGEGLGGNVHSLVDYNGELVAGGSIPSGSEFQLERWNGSSWAPLGGPMNGGAFDLLVRDGQLTVAGSFTKAGAVVSPYLATIGTTEITETTLTATTLAPSYTDERVQITVNVSASHAPHEGHVTVTGAPGGSCSDLDLSPISATSAQAQCSISWSAVGAKTLSARYSGGSSASLSWQPSSTSIALTHQVVPEEPNYSAIYYAPANAGYGVAITHQDQTVVAIWYTYDVAGRPVWYTAAAPREADGHYRGQYFLSSGTPMTQIAGSPAVSTTVAQGSVELNFGSNRQLDFAFTPNAGATQRRLLEPLPLAPTPLICRFALGSRAAVSNYSDLWWTPAENGWGLSVQHQGELIFLAWYTYAPDRQPQWLTAVVRRQADGFYRGRLNRSASGTPYTTPPNGAVTAFPVPEVGDVSLGFTSAENGQFRYTVDGVSHAKVIERLVFGTRVQVCD